MLTHQLWYIVAEGPGVAPATASIAATGGPVPPVATGPIAGDAEAGRCALTSCCTAARTASRIAGSIPRTGRRRRWHGYSCRRRTARRRRRRSLGGHRVVWLYNTGPRTEELRNTICYTAASDEPRNRLTEPSVLAANSLL